MSTAGDTPGTEIESSSQFIAGIEDDRIAKLSVVAELHPVHHQLGTIQ